MAILPAKTGNSSLEDLSDIQWETRNLELGGDNVFNLEVIAIDQGFTLKFALTDKNDSITIIEYIYPKYQLEQSRMATI